LVTYSYQEFLNRDIDDTFSQFEQKILLSVLHLCSHLSNDKMYVFVSNPLFIYSRREKSAAVCLRFPGFDADAEKSFHSLHVRGWLQLRSKTFLTTFTSFQKRLANFRGDVHTQTTARSKLVRFGRKKI